MKKIVMSDLIITTARKIAIARKEKIYLVGGYVRDLMLGRMTYDIDFALDGNVKGFSEKLARKLRGNFFVLDEKFQIFRIACKDLSCKSWNIDISKIQGKDIFADLKRRDFTIDAMAIDLNNGHCERERSNLVVLIDPFNGLQDLKRNMVRITSPKVLKSDPLRLLRAFRLAGTLGFRIENDTVKAISARSSFIKKVSKERIRDELFKIFSAGNSYEYIQQIDRAGLLLQIIPEIKKIKKEPGVWKHSILTLQFLEEIFKENQLSKIWSRAISKKINSHLADEISGQNARFTLLKFASFLHDIGKSSTKKILNGKLSFIGHDLVGAKILRKISEELRLSNKEIKIILNITKNHMRVHYLANLDFITKRAIVRLVRDLGDEIIELLLFTLADFQATPKVLKKQTFKKNQQVIKKITREYFKFKESRKFIRLITGHDLIKNFNMREGPEIGRILEEIELAQREGKIKTRQQAFLLISTILKKKTIFKLQNL